MAELPQEAQTVWTKNPRLKTLLGILVFVFIFCGLGLAVFARLQAQYRQRLGEEIKKTLPQHQAAPADGRLQVNQPQAGAVVGQAFSVSGVAEGWFEGAIAIKVFDSNNVLLYSGNATAEDNYNRPAPFEAAISLTAAATAPAGWLEFDDYSAKDGSLAYQKKVEISFSDYSAAGWKTYKNDQYGFEFQYPARWQFSSGSIKNVPKLQSDGSWSFSPYVAVGNPLSGMAVYSFYVFVGANPKGQSAPDYVKQMIAAAPADGPDSLKYDKAYPISVGGLDCYELYNFFGGDEGDERVYCANASLVFTISFPVGEANPNLASPQANNQTAQSMLQTFKISVPAGVK